MVLNMELPNGNECTTKPWTCCRKLANPSMEEINPYLKDGTKTNDTESLCQKLGGPRSKLLNMTRLLWRTIHESRWCSTTTKSTTGFCSSKTRMAKIARRICDKDSTRTCNHSSWSSSKTTKRISVRRNWRVWLRSRSSNRLEVTCRQLRPRQQIGTVTIGRREIGIPGILQGLTIREHVSQF